MAEEKSIKECLELLEGIKILAVETKKVLADGKVDLADLPVLMTLLTQFSKLSAAVEGIDQIPAEAKDLSSEEITALVDKVLEIVKVIKGA